MAIRVGKGRASIVIEGPMADGIEREISKILGPVVDEVKREGEAIVTKARADWPRLTGESADAWTTALQVEPGRYRVEIALINPIKYVRYIRSGKVGYQRGNRLVIPLQTLIRTPVREAAKRLKTTLPAIIGKPLDALLGGGHG